MPKSVRKSRNVQQSASPINDATVGTLCNTIWRRPVRGGGIHAPFKLLRGCFLLFLGIVAVESLDSVVRAREAHEGSFDSIARLGLGWIRHHPSCADVGNDTDNGIIVVGLLHFLSNDDVICDQQLPELGGKIEWTLSVRNPPCGGLC
jgi:hypothetical protein